MMAQFPGEELSAPKWHEELVILLLDGSGSMSEPERGTGHATKAEAVVYHLVQEPVGDGETAGGQQGSLLQRLESSRNADRFSLAVITFDDRVDVALHPRPLSEVQPEDLHIDLLGKHGGMTAIGAALEEASQLAQDWLTAPDADPRVPRYVTILLMSDGQETMDTDPVRVAERIKAHIQQGDTSRSQVVIATAAYGDDADAATLEAIASRRPDGSPFFKRVHTGAQLRDFFLESISTAAVARV